MDTSKLKEQMRNVPFGQSCFQIRAFSRGSETQERSYRNCLLQINQKLRALKECEFRRDRLLIDIDEINYNLKKASSFTEKRLEIDLKEKQYNLDEELKLIEDCMIELKTYIAMLDELPEFTREQFESAEYEYWEQRFLNDLSSDVASIGHASKGTIDSLKKIGILVGKNAKGQISYTKQSVSETDNVFLHNDKTA